MVKAIVLFAIMPCAFMTSGCYEAMRLHPVEGPLAAQAPPPVLQGKFPMVRSNMTVTPPDGEVCKGTLGETDWLPEAKMRSGWDFDVATVGTINTRPRPACAKGPCVLMSDWIMVWGPLLLNTPQRIYWTTLRGNRGTILNVEAVLLADPLGFPYNDRLPSPTEPYGVAVDNQGNTYKVVGLPPR